MVGGVGDEGHGRRIGSQGEGGLWVRHWRWSQCWSQCRSGSKQCRFRGDADLLKGPRTARRRRVSGTFLPGAHALAAGGPLLVAFDSPSSGICQHGREQMGENEDSADEGRFLFLFLFLFSFFLSLFLFFFFFFFSFLYFLKGARQWSTAETTGAKAVIGQTYLQLLQPVLTLGRLTRRLAVSAADVPGVSAAGVVLLDEDEPSFVGKAVDASGGAMSIRAHNRARLSITTEYHRV